MSVITFSVSSTLDFYRKQKVVMKAIKSRNIFIFITNLFGVSFYPQKLPLSVFLIFLILINMKIFYLSFYYPVKRGWLSEQGIYSAISILQSCFPILIHSIVIVQAWRLKEIQKNLWFQLQSKFTQKRGKCERKFIFRVLFIIIIRILKLICCSKLNCFVFNLQTPFSELIYSSSELMFIFFLELLVEYLDFIDKRIFMMRSYKDFRVIRHEIVNVFHIKIKIEKRFSVGLLITMSYNFLLNIFSFFFILKRIVFGRLKTLEDKSTFLHLIIPMFMFCSICFACEKFYNKVKNFLKIHP